MVHFMFEGIFTDYPLSPGRNSNKYRSLAEKNTSSPRFHAIFTPKVRRLGKSQAEFCMFLRMPDLYFLVEDGAEF